MVRILLFRVPNSTERPPGPGLIWTRHSPGHPCDCPDPGNVPCFLIGGGRLLPVVVVIIVSSLPVPAKGRPVDGSSPVQRSTRNLQLSQPGNDPSLLRGRRYCLPQSRELARRCPLRTEGKLPVGTDRNDEAIVDETAVPWDHGDAMAVGTPRAVGSGRHPTKRCGHPDYPVDAAGIRCQDAVRPLVIVVAVVVVFVFSFFFSRSSRRHDPEVPVDPNVPTPHGRRLVDGIADASSGTGIHLNIPPILLLSAAAAAAAAAAASPFHCSHDLILNPILGSPVHALPPSILECPNIGPMRPRHGRQEVDLDHAQVLETFDLRKALQVVDEGKTHQISDLIEDEAQVPTVPFG
mmetsp:Transcript_11096/g.24009  ORF Transcript_11096/g.24009 Transcript_11096/m.24009 type:complete len:350 (+) Transcript_11096:486-1535(+)